MMTREVGVLMEGIVVGGYRLMYRRQYNIFSIRGRYDACEARFARGSGAKTLSGHSANESAARQRSTDAQKASDPGQLS